MTIHEFVSQYKHCAINVDNKEELLEIIKVFSTHPRSMLSDKFFKEVVVYQSATGVRFKDGMLFSYKKDVDYMAGSKYGFDDTILEAAIRYSELCDISSLDVEIQDLL